MPFDLFGKKKAMAAQLYTALPTPPQPSHPTMSIIIRNGLDAQIVFSQLEDYLERLKHDKHTKYDGSKDYCEEDEYFLSDAILRTEIMLRHISQQHANLIRKM